MDVQGMMRARDGRARRQAALLEEHGLTLVCLGLNIAGPLKTNRRIEAAFRLACQDLYDALAASRLRVKHRETHLLPSGPEAYVCVEGGAQAVKALCLALEERDALGRLLDLDVLAPDGRKLSRQALRRPARGCLVCGRPGSYCAASRAHDAGTLYRAAMGIITAALGQRQQEKVGALATQALLVELAVTPKPGLVDRNNTGAHQDMDCHTFVASAAVLTGYFETCARLGRKYGAGEGCFARLRLEGKLAQGRMLRATGGVNTHQGAIFTLGILAAAAGYLLNQQQPVSPKRLSQASMRLCAAALEGERAQLREAVTWGERLMKGRLAGARAEAAAGFPTVMAAGLPALQEALAGGQTLDEAGARALLVIMLKAEDTVLLRRAGAAGAGRALADAARVLAGGLRPDDLLALDQAFICQGLSPGGSADLLAATLFVHLLEADGKIQG